MFQITSATAITTATCHNLYNDKWAFMLIIIRSVFEGRTEGYVAIWMWLMHLSGERLLGDACRQHIVPDSYRA